MDTAQASPALAASTVGHTHEFYIDGRWTAPLSSKEIDVVNPATEQPVATVALGSADDVDAAVAAAKRAFATSSQTSKQERIALLERIIAVYETRIDDIAAAVSAEMGAPITLARTKQAPAGLGHLRTTLAALRDLDFEEQLAKTTVRWEPVGVCGLITPWNWPLNQIALKVGPALAAGATVVLKPSEIAPLSAIVFAEVLDEAGVPAGVFNLVQGDGPGVGVALAEHPDVDMISFTGSTRAGIDVAQRAATTIKRVAQELGGKSANIILDDADLAASLNRDIPKMFANSGQSCNAGTRILVPHDKLEEASQIARQQAESLIVGSPDDSATDLGPLVSQGQFDKVQRLIRSAVDDGATLVTGGPGRPEGLETGYYVRPTVFVATNDMEIAQEEVFGPVLTLIGYGDEEEAVRIANDSPYGLSGMVSSGSLDRARAVARRMRTGMVHVNGGSTNAAAPFGGYKKSGNGREAGAHGIREYLEAKSLFGDLA